MKHWFSAVRSAWSHLPHIVRDIASRSARTFAGTFAMAVVANIAPVHNLVSAWSLVQCAAGAAAAAAGSVVLGAVGSLTGDPQTARFGR